MRAAPSSRLGQIEVLVGAAELPLPAIDGEHFEVIAEVIKHAFDGLAREHPGILRTGTEAEVSGLVRGRLNEFLLPPRAPEEEGSPLPLWRQLASAVALGSETPSYDAKRLESRPDLNIHLTLGHPSFPLVGECKLIDAAAAKTVRLYCDNGLTRFLDGQYAWAAREAMMVAYVRDGSSISSLDALLFGAGDGGGLSRYGVRQTPIPVRTGCFELSWSAHGRDFSYLSWPNTGRVPGPIAIWHLWLACPPPVP